MVIRTKLFEKMGFELSHGIIGADYENIYTFKKMIISSDKNWSEMMVASSYPDRTHWYLVEEKIGGNLGRNSKITFDEVFNSLTAEQQEIAIWHLDLLR